MKQPSKDRLRIYIIISTILLTLSLLPAFIMAMFSPMMFDSPGSEDNPITLALVIGMISYPFVTILCGIIAWILFVRTKRRLSILLISIPYLHILLIICLFITLEMVCDGSFSC